MSDSTFEQIADKYIEMNVAHPFREGNGRTTRIRLDLMLKRALKKCVDWSKINKKEYLEAMAESVTDASNIKSLLRGVLTGKINDREMFMPPSRIIFVSSMVSVLPSKALDVHVISAL